MTDIALLSLRGRMAPRAYRAATLTFAALWMSLLETSRWERPGDAPAALGLLALAGIAIATMTVRRLHDAGRPGRAAAWTIVPLLPATAIAMLQAGPLGYGRDATMARVVVAISAALGLWGVIGTAWVMRLPSAPGPNDHGEQPADVLPDAIVAGDGTIGPFGRDRKA